MPDMMSIVNLLAPLPSDGIYNVYRIICLVLLVVMMAGALVSILIILFQPGNSTGIDALGGSSETFFGKNKGRSMESRMKRWTVISSWCSPCSRFCSSFFRSVRSGASDLKVGTGGYSRE